jgi:2-methylcitrate dehydratase PrpD
MSELNSIIQKDPMGDLCQMVIETRYEKLPEDVVRYAKYSILDTIGIIIGGSAMEGIPEIVDFVKDKGGKPEGLIPFYGIRVPASEVGFALGPMARAMDFGDVHEEASHSSEYTIPTLLSVMGLKSKVTGKEFITAYVVGQEVLIRIGIAYKGASKGVPLGRGSGHSIFGCVAAAGKLLGLNFNQLMNAQGIARLMTQPHDLTMYNPATLMVRVHHGFVSQDAINATLLSTRGINGPCQEVLIGPRGYLGFAKWETDPGALTRGLGEKWEMKNTMMKAYAGCKGTHTSIDGLLDQMKEHQFTAQDIDTIDFDESSINWSLVCESREKKWNPNTVSECQFSLPYVVATAAYDKYVLLDSYTPEAIKRRNVRDLMSKISAKEDPKLPPFAARVYVTLKDGRRFFKECIYSKGHPANPLTPEELIEKFKKCIPYCACTLTEEATESLIKKLLNLDKVDDVVNALFVPLTPI